MRSGFGERNDRLQGSVCSGGDRTKAPRLEPPIAEAAVMAAAAATNITDVDVSVRTFCTAEGQAQ
jgi:hypothetical protein